MNTIPIPTTCPHCGYDSSALAAPADLLALFHKPMMHWCSNPDCRKAFTVRVVRVAVKVAICKPVEDEHGERS